MAPELMDANPEYRLEVDVFSYAITLWELVTGVRMRDQFAGQPSRLYEDAVKNRGQRPPLSQVKEEWLSHLLERCWSDQWKDRPSFKQILCEFAVNEFRIVPGVDKEEVEAYLAKLTEFERTREQTPP
jgi:hypothetical protein